MLPGGTRSNSIQFSPTYFHPPGAAHIFPRWQGRLLSQPWCGLCCWPAATTVLPALGAAKPPNSANSSTFGEEIQTVLSPELSNNFKMFCEACFCLSTKHSPSAWNLLTSDDISDTRKLDLVFECFQTQLLPPHLSLFYKGLFSAADVLVSLQITLSPGSCRHHFASLFPPLLTTEQVLLLLDGSFPRVCTQPGGILAGDTGKGGSRHGESLTMRITAAVSSLHPGCHSPQLGLLLSQGA